MKVLNMLVFDDTLSDLETAWYTPEAYNDQLGQHDQIAVQASIGEVSGTLPSLMVLIEHSADGRHWLPVGDVPDILVDLAPNTVFHAFQTGAAPSLLGFVRLAASLDGTQPKCRLKLFVTCRDY